jgi:hypothetical protein
LFALLACSNPVELCNQGLEKNGLALKQREELLLELSCKNASPMLPAIRNSSQMKHPAFLLQSPHAPHRVVFERESSLGTLWDQEQCTPGILCYLHFIIRFVCWVRARHYLHLFLFPKTDLRGSTSILRARPIDHKDACEEGDFPASVSSPMLS